MARLNLSSPWVIYYREVEQLFAYDPEVHVIYDDEEDPVLKLYVDTADKAEAIQKILPKEENFGLVNMKILVIPANTVKEIEAVKALKTLNSKAKKESIENVYERAFANNPILAFVKTVHGIFTNDITYVVFKPIIVQYFNDDLGDINGACTTLYQDIAKNVLLDDQGIYFCTDVVDGLRIGMPLGEWP